MHGLTLQQVPRRAARIASVTMLLALLGIGAAGCTNNGNGQSTTTNGVRTSPSGGASVSISPGPPGASPTNSPTASSGPP